MSAYKILHKSVDLYEITETSGTVTIKYNNYKLVIKNCIKIWKSKYKNRVTSVLVQKSDDVYILIERGVYIFNIYRGPVIKYEAEYVSPGIIEPKIYTLRSEYDPIKRINNKNDKKFDVVILHMLRNQIRKKIIKKCYELKKITFDDSIKFEYPLFAQYNNYFALKIPDFFDKNIRGKYLPCDTKLVNYIKWMWSQKIITRAWDEPSESKLGFISFKSEFKNIILDNLKTGGIKIKEYDMKKISYGKSAKQMNDRVKEFFKTKKNTIHYEFNIGHKYHVIRFSISILRKIHKILNIEYPDITGALPGLRECEKYIYDNYGN